MILKKNARLDYFDSAFFFVYNLRDQLKRKLNKYEFRLINSPLNCRLDVQPIPNWMSKIPPVTVGFDRKIYVTIALNHNSGPGEVVLNIALRLRTVNLGVVAYVEDKNGKQVNLLLDTTSVNEGQESTISDQILDHLLKAYKAWRDRE
jgi:hypothetical protein